MTRVRDDEDGFGEAILGPARGVGRAGQDGDVSEQERRHPVSGPGHAEEGASETLECYTIPENEGGEDVVAVWTEGGSLGILRLPHPAVDEGCHPLPLGPFTVSPPSYETPPRSTARPSPCHNRLVQASPPFFSHHAEPLPFPVRHLAQRPGPQRDFEGVEEDRGDAGEGDSPLTGHACALSSAIPLPMRKAMVNQTAPLVMSVNVGRYCGAEYVSLIVLNGSTLRSKRIKDILINTTRQSQ